MTEYQVQSLLPGIRDALPITWVDPQTDKQLLGIIARGVAYFNEIAGHPVDFTQEGKGRELLINYCLYARSNALDQFPANYREDITFFQIGEEVKLYREEADDPAV